jgi:hypothetical protein
MVGGRAKAPIDVRKLFLVHFSTCSQKTVNFSVELGVRSRVPFYDRSNGILALYRARQILIRPSNGGSIRMNQKSGI